MASSRQSPTEITSTKVNVAVCLAAGFGTRMRPLTDTTPKPLIKVQNQTMLDRVLDKLRIEQIPTIVVNGHYLSAQIKAHLMQNYDNQVLFSDETDTILDSGGGVKQALKYIDASTHSKPEAIYVINADQFWQDKSNQSNLQNMQKMWSKKNDIQSDKINISKCDILMLLAAPEQSLGYDGKGDFVMNESGQLTRYNPENTGIATCDTPKPWAYMGVCILKTALLESEEENVFSLNKIFDKALAKGTCYGLPLQGEWYHVGTPKALQEAEVKLQKSQTLLMNL